MPESTLSKYNSVAATTAAITGVLNLIKKGGGGFPPEVLTLLAEMANSLSDVDATLLPEILAAIKTMPVGGAGGAGYPPNTPSFDTSRVQIAALGQWYQLPDIVVPDGMGVLVKGAPTNKGIVYVAKSETAVININQAWPLLPNEMVQLKVQNVNAIYTAGIAVGGSVIGDYTNYVVEQ